MAEGTPHYYLVSFRRTPAGDKDGNMLLWDLRAPQHVGAFGTPGQK